MIHLVSLLIPDDPVRAGDAMPPGLSTVASDVNLGTWNRETDGASDAERPGV